MTIAENAIEALRRLREVQEQHRARLGRDYHDHGLVFCTRSGNPLLPRFVIQKYKAALTRAGLSTTYRFHVLRHAHATALLAAGVHPKIASERLGHSSVAMTMDVYSHSVEGLDDDAAQKVQQAIEQAQRT